VTSSASAKRICFTRPESRADTWLVNQLTPSSSDGDNHAVQSSDGRRIYFVGPFTDFFFMGGASFAVFALLVYAFVFNHPFVGSGLLSALAFGAYLGNNPHFHATNERLYRSRATIAQYPLTALLVPILLAGGTLASLAFPFDVAPYFIKLFLIWSPYHFAAQALGLSLIYCRRAGITVEPLERRALSWFLFATCALTWVRTETGRITEYYGIYAPQMMLPRVALPLAWLWTGGTFLAFAWAARRWWRRNGRLPLIVLFPVVVHFAWFVLGGRVPYMREFTNFFHSVQYLFIAWAMRSKERADAGLTARAARPLLVDSLRWFAINCAVGGGLFFGVPPLLARTPMGHDLGHAFIVGVFWSAYQLQHFFADSVIWKLKNREVSAPLMGQVSELLHSTG
jgi:hypothetical protein